MLNRETLTWNKWMDLEKEQSNIARYSQRMNADNDKSLKLLKVDTISAIVANAATVSGPAKQEVLSLCYELKKLIEEAA